ncbi:disease resistance protein PIK6-NP-like [Miscanthus floridulus]|uniref:disease resistance protein PIK6-NP-like n=1 Tax=Miscanthus floridulus TaxID=154761 RepID=UPI00345A01BB
MAEFSLGLTKTAVEGTLSLVKSAVEDEKKLSEKVQNDLVFISGEFEMMQSFLRVSNSNKNDDQVVLTWVRQLRNLPFDFEDCVENVVHLDLDKSLHWGWLRRLWQMVNCRAPPLPLDAAVAEIKQLDRVDYNLHDSNNNDNKQQPAVTAVMPPLAEQPPDATTYPSSASAFHILGDAWKDTGKWRGNTCNLQELITSVDDGPQVFSVWGSTVGDDLSTASILTEAYWDPKICEKFKSRAWVKLMHPFNQDEFVKSLLAQFYASSSHQANAGVDFWTRMKPEVTEEDKLPKLMQKMSEQRYLVVLENVVAVAQNVPAGQ